MGNYLSCSFPAAGGRSSNSTKVIFPGGEIRHISFPIKAAELMLEEPSFFLVNARCLQIGRRFPALAADEDLEMANVYVMFPMKRVNSVVTAADMGVLFLTAKRVSGEKAKITAGNQVGVADTIDHQEKVGSSPETETDDSGKGEEIPTPFFMHRLSTCRLRKPLLEPIAEDQATR